MAAMTLEDRIIFQDTEAMVIDKPAGLAVDPPRDGSPNATELVAPLTFGRTEIPTPVHRLDRDTSGALLLGRTARAHRRLSRQFEAGLVEKRYLAIVDGVPGEMQGIIDMPLGKTSTKATGWRMVPDASGKPSRTQWRVIASYDNRALVELTPETGRTHQLRVHMASGLGHAIVGDPFYGSDHPAGMMLHAADLVVPRDGRDTIHAHAPFPDRFIALGFTDPDVSAVTPS